MKRSHTTDSAADGKKKTRFVAPEDDPARFDEHVADQLETARDTAKGRRGKVRTEGYESDSSDEGESVVRSRAKNPKGAQDEDDDMFAMGEKAAAKEEDGTASGKKEEKYLRLGDIEGQEFGNDASGSGGERGLGSEASEEDSESESEGEPEDEDDAERRAKAGMGFELSSFNMREEMEEGKFTEDGSFVRTFDPHAAHDRWLEGTDEREMKKARRAQRAKAKAERERRRKEAKEEKEGGGKEDIVIEMLGLLKRGETVLEALARLGEKTKKTKGKENGVKKLPKIRADPSMDLDSSNALPPKSTTSTKASAETSKIERLTDLASRLLSFGDVDIYNKTYEHLLRSVQSAGNVKPDWMPPAVKYEYKWDVPEAQTRNEGSEPQVFGPFGEDEMNAWREANYFGPSGEKVKVRVIGREWGDWDDVID